MLTAQCSKSLWLLVEERSVKGHLSRITACNEPTTSFERDHVTQADFSVLISPWLGQITSGLPTIRPPGRQDTDDNFRVGDDVRSVFEQTIAAGTWLRNNCSMSAGASS